MNNLPSRKTNNIVVGRVAARSAQIEGMIWDRNTPPSPLVAALSSPVLDARVFVRRDINA